MIHKKISEIQHSSVLHIVIGAFDGMHLAHQKLIKEAVDNAKTNNETSMIFSFEPLPKEFFLKEKFGGRLLLAPQKHSLLEEFGADHVIIADFKSIRNLSENEFIKILLSKADKLVLYSGDDFRMGCLEGNSYTEKNVVRIVHQEIIIDGDHCRASTIRNLIKDGEIIRANKLLGREYTIYSHSVSGNKIGRSISFPTINSLPNNQIIPQAGVYFGEIKVQDIIYPTAIYVGKRPTVHGIELRIESHILEDFPYPNLPVNTPTEVCFIQKIAEEKSFKSLEELSEMLYNYKIVSSALAAERYNKK